MAWKNHILHGNLKEEGRIMATVSPMKDSLRRSLKASAVPFAAGFALVASAALAGVLDNAWLKGPTDKNPLF